MFSRLSSFSGPLSPVFRLPGGFTLNGLILRYVIGDTNSYSGTSSVIDLQGNSNGTLYNGQDIVGIGPTYSLNGYLNFDGVNDYIMTNTSLNSKLSPANTSTIISHFIWIYPQDNGVIVTEQGDTSLNGVGWHDSQIEIVSGTLKFGVWNGIIISSSISISLYNWYYVGLTYDGITLRGYVNGQLAGSITGSRSTPQSAGNGLHYAIGANDGTSLGDGSYAKMKLGDFHVYNTALSQQQILNNYNATKNDYIYTGSMSIWIDANDPASFSGGSISDLSGNGYTHSLVATSSTIFGFKSFNCTAVSNNYIRVNGTGPLLPTSGYTYVAWARISADSSTYRTLYRSSPNDHALLVQINTDNLGFWDNDSNSFKDSGYDVSSIEEKWVQYSVVGDSSSSIFYINDVEVGATNSGASGNRHDYFGGIDGQPFGYVGNMMLYNKKLSQSEIKQNYDALKNVYKNGDFVISNIGISLLPSNAGSTIWSDSKGNFNATMSGSPSYNNTGYTFNGTSQYGRIVSSTGITDFTNTNNYTIEVWTKPSSGQPNSTTTILEKWNLGNSSNYPYTLRFTEGSSTAYFACYDGTNFPQGTLTGVSVGNWYQLVGVFNFTTDVLTVYKNGISAGTASLVGVGGLSNTSPVGIAHRVSIDGSSAEFMFKGSIGIIRIYSSALSASDVSKNFEANRNIYGISDSITTTTTTVAPTTTTTTTVFQGGPISEISVNLGINGVVYTLADGHDFESGPFEQMFSTTTLNMFTALTNYLGDTPNAEFNLDITQVFDNQGNLDGYSINLYLSTPGNGYNVGDIITIPGSEIGGTDNTDDDLIITVTSIS